MIARFMVRLPFTFHISATEPLQDQVAEVGGMTVVMRPPYRTLLSPEDLDEESGTSVMDRARLVSPRPDPDIDPTVLLNGEPSFRCDGLMLDFVRESFDRAYGASDPPHELALSFINDWLGRLRLMAQASQIHVLDPLQTLWQIQYLNDDESEFEPTEGLKRTGYGSAWRFSSVGITADLWSAVGSLPWGYQASPAESLLLDAHASVQEIGPAVVLAVTALETRVAQALDILAPMYGVQSGVWSWVNDRGFFLKNPSTEEQFDSLLKSITGRTLKEDQRLWEGFQNLRTARNRFAHNGVASIGNSEEPLDWQKASALVAIAREITDWVEDLLPGAYRRPRYENTDTFQSQMNFAEVADPPLSSQDDAVESPDDITDRDSDAQARDGDAGASPLT